MWTGYWRGGGVLVGLGEWLSRWLDGIRMHGGARASENLKNQREEGFIYTYILTDSLKNVHTTHQKP